MPETLQTAEHSPKSEINNHGYMDISTNLKLLLVRIEKVKF